jgi:hypothetical protein
MGVANKSVNSTQPRIIDRLSRMGVNAGMANRLQVLSTAEAKATSDMHRIYGNMTRVIHTADSKAVSVDAWDIPVAIAVTTHGAAIMPRTVITIRA